jgi:hypothetical protein
MKKNEIALGFSMFFPLSFISIFSFALFLLSSLTLIISDMGFVLFSAELIRMLLVSFFVSLITFLYIFFCNDYSIFYIFLTYSLLSLGYLEI